MAQGGSRAHTHVLVSWQPPYVVVVAAAFAAIGVANALGLVPPRAYGVLFVAVFAWVGLTRPNGSALKVLPLFAIAYSVPLLDANPPLDLRAALVVGATGVFVAETIASAKHRIVQARLDAVRAANAFRIVARAGASLQRLDHGGVLDAVVDAVMALGYDGANLVVIDDSTRTFVLVHPRGLAIELGADRKPLGSGLTAMVQATRQPVVVGDYLTWEHSIEHYRRSGVRSLIGVPVVCNDRLVGVLVASTRDPRPLSEADIEPLQALAEVAGASLANAEAYESEQTLAQQHEQASRTDALTGLPNRRDADRALRATTPGTVIVMVDVDHFRQVNERLGHAGGDQVLQDLAGHLAGRVRAGDYVARFGGEELILLLPGRELASGTAIVERLAASWRATHPATTFSAGVARHRGDDVARTLARADAALYEAKRAGRDRCVSEADLRAPAG